jgi:hypothetical protein
VEEAVMITILIRRWTKKNINKLILVIIIIILKGIGEFLQNKVELRCVFKSIFHITHDQF